MTRLPKIDTAQLEREGVAVVTDLAARPRTRGGLGFIFREQGPGDVGIDGHLEVVDERTNEATGRIVGVQVKAGPSYFQRRGRAGWAISIPKSKVLYWRQYSVPVILVAVNVDTRVAYWALVSAGDHRESARSVTIPLPEAQRFDATAADAIAALAAEPPPWLAARLREITEELSRTTAAELERQRGAWREGHRHASREWIEGWVSAPARLRALAPPVAASLLRFGSAIALDGRGDQNTAIARLDEARRIDPSGDDPTAAEARIHASILASGGDLDGAIALLHSAPGVPAQHLRASLLLALGRPAEVESVLDASNFSEVGGAPNERGREDPHDQANSFRLRALARLELGDFDGAAAAAERAKSFAPRHLLVRWTWAALAYYRGLVPDAVPKWMPPWPPPVRKEDLRRDPAGLAAFADSAEEFARVLEADLDRAERRHAEAWRLAALAAGPDRDPALAFAADVLRQDPAHPYAILWAAYEGLPLDLRPHFDALSDEAERTGDVDAARLYATARHQSGYVEGLLGWLDRWRARFESEGDQEAWALLRVRTLVALGELDVARAALDGLSPVARSLLEADIAAAEVARAGGDRGLLVAHLEAAASRTGDPHFLLEACHSAAQASDWRFVARHVDDLLRRFPTPPVRRLAIFARFNTRDDDACLTLLEDALERREAGADLNELRRIRAEVCARTGRVPEAATAFERMVAEAGPTAATADLLRLAQLQFTLGRTHELAATAARIRARPDLTAESSLMLADVLANDDPPLACELWERASSLGVPDALVTAAVTLGYRLGLDQRLRVLSERMAVLAASGSPFVHQFTFEELLAYGEDRARRRTNVLELYARGEIPNHVVAQFLGEPLSHLYHAVPEANARQASPRYRFAVQFRDGGRGIARPDATLAGPNGLALDLSALLLAHHIGVLPLVEQHFAPLRLPQVAVAALQDLRDRLHPHQPSRVEASRRLLEAERLGWIEPWAGELPTLDVEIETAAGPWARWVALLERARQEGAFVLDLPLDAPTAEPSPHSRPAVVAGEPRVARLVTVQALRRRLREMGAAEPAALSMAEAGDVDDGGADSADSAPERAPQGDPVTSGVPLPRGSVVYLTDAGAEALASAGLLQAAAEFFVLRVDPDDLAGRQAHRDDLATFAERATWIERLIRRVAEGLNDGRYALLPLRQASAMGPDARGSTAASAIPLPDRDAQPACGSGSAATGTPSEAEGEDEEDATGDEPAATNQPTLRLLEDLLSLPSGAVDAVWIDDRYINRYRLAGATRIVDTLEVLGALEAAGLLSTERRFALHTDLRAGNIRVLPLGADELAHHLRTAPVEGGELGETRALRVLRQYTGSLLAEAHFLRVPGPAELAGGSVGDLELLRVHAGAVKEALVDAWRSVRDPADTAAVAVAEARSRWLVENLYLDLGLLRARVVHPHQAVEPRLSALEAASLFLGAGLELLSGADSAERERADAVATAFSAWVDAQLVSPRAERDPIYRRAVADELRRVLADWPARHVTTAGEPARSAPADGDDAPGAAATAPDGGLPGDVIEGHVPDVEGAGAGATRRVPDPRLALQVARILAGRLYDTLPDAWKEEVARDSALMEFVGRGITHSLSFGSYDVASGAFAAAAAAALAGTPSRVPTLGDDPNSVLSVSSNDGVSLSVTPSDGGKPFTIKDAALGVLAVDHQTRRAAFAASRRVVDVCVETWRAITEQLVAEEDPARRLLAIFDRRQSALPFLYDEMHARWRAEHRLQANDLRPPSAATLRSHLRLDDSSALGFDTWERAARMLIDEEGLDIALERLAGVPVPVPAPLLDALATLVPEVRRALLLRVLRRPCSPVAAVNLLTILARLGGAEARYLRWGVRLLRHVGSDAWRASFRLLRELVATTFQAKSPALGSTAADAEDSPGAGEGADPAGELLAAWYHAHRLVTAATALAIDPDALVSHVRRRTGHADSLFAPSDLRRDEAHPASTSHVRFVLAGLQHALPGTALIDQRSALEKALRALFRPAPGSAAQAEDDDDATGSVPAIQLLRDSRGRSNLTGSWLPLVRGDDGAVAVGEIVVVPPSFAPDLVIAEALDALAGDASAPEGWGAIAAVLGPEPLVGAHADRFELIASSLDVPALLRSLGGSAPLAASRLARQSLAPGAAERRERLRGALLAAVREDRAGSRSSSPRRGSDSLSDLQTAVLEALYVLAGAEPGPTESMRAFARDLETLGRKDADYLRHFRSLIEELVRTRPLAEAHALTALLGASRAG